MNNERLSSQDHAWLQETIATINELEKQKQTLYSFVTGVLQKRYKLEPGDELNNDTGEIKRFKKGPELVKEVEDAKES